MTSQFLEAAALQILDPRNPFPPNTTILFAAAVDIVDGAVRCGIEGERVTESRKPLEREL